MGEVGLGSRGEVGVMTLLEALLVSRENGSTYMRVGGGGGFVRWDDQTVYRFTATDLVADDWENVETGIPKLTKGRWGAVEQ